MLCTDVLIAFALYESVPMSLLFVCVNGCGFNVNMAVERIRVVVRCPVWSSVATPFRVGICKPITRCGEWAIQWLGLPTAISYLVVLGTLTQVGDRLYRCVCSDDSRRGMFSAGL